MRELSIDIETYSEVDLRKVGTHVYAAHPSTEIMCLAYAIDDDPVQIWRVAEGEKCPEDFRTAWTTDGVIRRAWNAGGFEMLFHGEINRLVDPFVRVDPILGHPCYTSEWSDTMIRSAYWGGPMGLDMASAWAFGLPFTKDMAGHRLMLQMSKPRKRAGGHISKWHEDDPAKYDRLCAYCMADVEVERAISKAIPPLPHATQKDWELDWEIMQRGMPVDLSKVEALQDIAEMEIDCLNQDMYELTQGEVRTTSSVGALLKWVQAQAPELGVTALDKASLEAVFHRQPHNAVPLNVRRALGLRYDAAKSSVAKLQAFRNTTGDDGRVRGLTQFYGASRTGRWAGRLLQVQNMPRPIKNPRTALERISSDLRSCFVAPAGSEFIVGDFSQIEARVIAWLADQHDILDVFRQGEDVYTYTANKLGSTDRQFGKVLVLACGFGMGPGKFQETAKTYGLDLSFEAASNAVKSWREANPAIVQYWRALEDACKRAISEWPAPGPIPVGQGFVQVAMGKGRLSRSLLIRLPSGRHLVYRNACLVKGDEDWKGMQIAYDGVNQYTRKWEQLTTYGGKLAENVTQAVARDFLMHALWQLDGNGYNPLVTIHDEVVCLENSISAMPRTAKSVMERVPPWAVNFPLAADVKAMRCYGK